MNHRMHQGFRLQLDEWVSLLSISTLFDFATVRSRAIYEIEHAQTRLDPIEKIVLAEKHDIPEWLAPAYEALCRRYEPLEEVEAEMIGYKKTVLLLRAREALRDETRNPTRPRASQWQSLSGPSTPRPATPNEYHHIYFDDSTVTWIVRVVFFQAPTVGNPEIPQ